MIFRIVLHIFIMLDDEFVEEVCFLFDGRGFSSFMYGFRRWIWCIFSFVLKIVWISELVYREGFSHQSGLGIFSDG